MTIDEEALEWAKAAARGGKHVIVFMVDPDYDHAAVAASRGLSIKQAILLLNTCVHLLETQPETVVHVPAPRAS